MAVEVFKHLHMASTLEQIKHNFPHTRLNYVYVHKLLMARIANYQNKQINCSWHNTIAGHLGSFHNSILISETSVPVNINANKDY